MAGCLIELMFTLLTYTFIYLVVKPALFIIRLLNKTGLIWSVTFYTVTEFYFQNSIIQEYRMAITYFLLVFFIWKTFKLIKMLFVKHQLKQRKKLERKESATKYE